MATRAIITHQPEVSCDMCGRRLLRGERPDTFLAAGTRRIVCELCIPRAAGEGWKRESEALAAIAAAGVRSPRARRGRSLLDRLRQRRPGEPGMDELGEEQERWPQSAPARDGWQDAPAGGLNPQDQEPWQPQEAGEESQQAVSGEEWADRQSLPLAEEQMQNDEALVAPAPAGAQRQRLSTDLTAEQAIEIFNASECAARVAGIARALGEPSVTVRQHDQNIDRVNVVVAWELCWYRYEVDLNERPATIALLGEGTELDELPDEDKLGNAAADERGELSLLR